MRNGAVVMTGRPRRSDDGPQSSRRWSAPRRQALFPPRPARESPPRRRPTRRASDRGPRPDRGRTSFATCRSPPDPARSSAWPGWRDRGRPLLGVLFGTRAPTPGASRFADGDGAAELADRAAARRGISLVPADRRHQGLMLDAEHVEIANVAVGVRVEVPSRSRRPWLDRGAMRGGRSAPDRRAPDPATVRRRSSAACPAATSRRSSSASGWRSRPTVFLLDDPTRGVDVGAKREIYRLIRELADSGRTVLFRSTELPEVVGLADRILVLYRGRLAAEAVGGEIDDQRPAARHQHRGDVVTATDGWYMTVPSSRHPSVAGRWAACSNASERAPASERPAPACVAGERN